MFRNGFVPLLQMQIRVAVQESELAGEDLVFPLQPAEAKGTALQQSMRKIDVELALAIPAEYAGFSIVVPSPAVELEERGKKLIQFRRAATPAKAHIGMPFEVSQNRPDSGAEPRPQSPHIFIPRFRQ